jgi:hypothetical protein
MSLSNFFEAKFEGAFKPKDGQHIGTFYFNEIDFVFLNILDYSLLNFSSLASLEIYKTEDFLFKDIIKNKKINSQNNISISIFKDKDHYYSDNLFNVLIKNITFSKDSYFVDGTKVYHIKGTIFFQLKKKAKSISQIFISNKEQHINNSGINIEQSSLTTANDTNVLSNIISSSLNTSNIQNNTSNFFRTIIKLFKWIFIICILLLLFNKLYHYIKKPISVPSKNESIQVKSVDKDSGVSSKNIKWQDFSKNNFLVQYHTKTSEYNSNKEFQAASVQNSLSPNQYQFFSNLFNELSIHDADKIDFLVSKIEKLAKEKDYNSHELAELVVTLIQSIPYCLVHDYSCEKAMSEPNADFLISYHKSGKPCLSNIPAGVQSPYEFIHNLKGDCDTRALLAYTILSKLNISSSIWMSQQYGHSVVGIGLPSSGVYKNINGVKHYATELTAKGYQIGMISPSQRNTSNWEIGTYNNF